MRSTFLGLEVSKRSIQISQKALDITNNNLSNRGVTGYTRQRVDINSLYLEVTGKCSTKLARLSIAGQGSNSYGVDQIRDDYIDKRYREFTAYVAEYDTKSSVIGDVEDILGDVSDIGLVRTLEDFKKSLSTYAANHPDNTELSSVVRNSAESICKTLRGYSTKLNDLRNDNLVELEDSISEVNDIIDKIVKYNKTIVDDYGVTAADRIYNNETVIGTYGPNELLDERNVLIDELSYYGDIKVYDNSDGSVRILMGGTEIVNGEKYEHMFMKNYDDYNAAVVKFTNGDIANLASGDIKAYVDLLNGNGGYASYYQNGEYGIPYYQSTLDAFAQSFSKLMNEINGSTELDSSRAMFGSSDDEYDDDGNLVKRGIITAANIRVSEEWMKDSKMIGKTYDEEKKEWILTNLDNSTVNKLYLGMDKPLDIGDPPEFSGSVYDYCLFVDNRFAQSISFYNKQYELYSDNASTLLDERSAISGVSETEEGINMMTYQKWFNASSRLMTTLDEALDRLINSTGRVGL